MMWDDDWELDVVPIYTARDERVLVVVVPTAADWERICAEHWYRIPLRRAPKRIGAEYLAFYHPKALGERAWSIAYYAPVLGVAIVTRRELLPAEADHPRAGDLYYRYELGAPQALQPPIPSHKLRRVTFIMTTLSRLLAAREIQDLWLRDSTQQRLGRAALLREWPRRPGPYLMTGSGPSSDAYSARMPGT
jgi:hypothetical protein